MEGYKSHSYQNVSKLLRNIVRNKNVRKEPSGSRRDEPVVVSGSVDNTHNVIVFYENHISFLYYILSMI